ncbi:MAG: 2-hydroxychromene-2-carboxylate isomerase [Kiritimatiellia bacterium]|jgi:2-hydroxychromene-2-carboxylate isomerase
MRTLVFYYDIQCPYAWVASTRVAELTVLAERVGVRVVWRPVLLGGIYRSIGAPDSPAMAMNPAKARLNLLDVTRGAELLGLPLRYHPRHPRRSVAAMRLLVGCDDAVRPALTAALYRVYWVDNGDISDPETLARVAREHGVDPSLASAPSSRQGLFDNTHEAVQIGAFGVPVFRLGDQMWYGGDRMHLVAQALGGAWPSPQPLPRSSAGHKITFFHDFSSPFSYLASTQIERIAREENAEIEWVPMLLGALFREVGTPDVPLLAMSDAKRRWYSRDLMLSAAWWQVPFGMPRHFPLRTVTALRAAIVEPALTSAIYAAVWSDGRNVGDKSVLQHVIDEAGFDGRSIIDRTSDPSIKGQLFTNTARAVASGVCGAPTCEVGGTVFWGQDRLEQVRAAVRGWRCSLDGAASR